MRILETAYPSPAMRGTALLLSVAWLASGCSSTGASRPEVVETRDASGFTITQKVRISAEVRRKFESALRKLEDEEYDDAITLLQAVTEAAPNVVAPHVDLGIAHAQVGHFEAAELSIQRALELNPRHPVAHNELGILYRKMGRFEEARNSYEHALAEYPDFHFARRNLGILCDVYLGDLSCALEQYGVYTQMVPDDEAAAMWVADLRNRTGLEE